MKVFAMIGYKFMKEEDDCIKIIRLASCREYADKEALPAEVGIIDENGEVKKMRLEELVKEYTPIEPDAVFTVSIARMMDGKKGYVQDVITTVQKFINMKIGDTVPFALCRQNMVDIFHNLVVTSVDDSGLMYGCAINQNDCPTNFNFRSFFAVNDIKHTKIVNFYRTDTLDDILNLIITTKYDEVLTANRKEFAKQDIKKNPKAKPGDLFKSIYRGWCSTLKELLELNNFMNDINEMFGCTDVDFDIKPYIIDHESDNGNHYQSVNDQLRFWLSHIYKVNMKNTMILEYNIDINLADFNNTRYIFLRDRNKVLYILSYTLEDEERYKDLQDEYEKMSFADELRLSFKNKYQESKI